MLRKIEFRAWSIEDHGWVFGDLEYNRKRRRAKIHSYHDDGSYKGYFEVEVETVGQFSGLCDMNGNAIYEGDIVEWEKDNRKYVIKFWDGMFYASVKEYNDGIFGGFPLHAFTQGDEGYRCKIVGNIHDGI